MDRTAPGAVNHGYLAQIRLEIFMQRCRQRTLWGLALAKLAQSHPDWAYVHLALHDDRTRTRPQTDGCGAQRKQP